MIQQNGRHCIIDLEMIPKEIVNKKNLRMVPEWFQNQLYKTNKQTKNESSKPEKSL